MIKYCEDCGIEISDTDYDNYQRFIRVKRCAECATKHKLEQNQTYRRKRKMEKRIAAVVEQHELTETAKACRKVRRAANEQVKLRKEENKTLREALMQERAKNQNRGDRGGTA